MTIKNYIGAGMLVILFGGLFGWMAASDGFEVALKVIGIATAVFIFTGIATYLLGD